MKPLLVIDHLSVSYDGMTPALSDAYMMLAAGRRIGLIGESGSGKTTLALAVAGLLPRDAHVSGTIGWNGGNERPRNGTDIGYVFQDPAESLDPVMRVGAQVAEVVKILRETDHTNAHQIALNLLLRVGFSEPDIIAARFPHQLSGGQKQRVAIACALAGQPKLLIADEATSALDTIVQAGIVQLLNRLVDEDGLSLLFITHDLPLASTLADALIVLKDGRVVESGATRNVIGSPRHPYVAQLVASHIALDGPRLLETRRAAQP